MTIFDEISLTCSKLKSVEDKIEYNRMQASAPRSSIISDMPKGGGSVGNPLEQYIVRQEELNEKRKALKALLDRQWAKAVEQMNAAKIDKQTKTMIYLRFVRDLQWKRCAAELESRFPNNKWNVNKCFRKYREVLCRIRKS